MKTTSTSISPSLTTNSQNYGFWKCYAASGKIVISDRAKSIIGASVKLSSHLVLLAKYIFPEYQKKYISFLREVFENHKNECLEVKLKTPHGFKYLSIAAEYLIDTQEIIGWVQDITELKNSQQLINRRISFKSKLEKITNTASFEWNLSDEYLICSDNFFEMASLEGYNDNNQLNKSIFFSLIESQKRNFVLDVMHECVTLNQEFEVTFFTENSQRKKFKVYGYPVGDLTSKKLLGVITDITGEVQMEASIIKGQEKERKRLSMELHDSVGQKLVAMKYMIALFKLSNDYSKSDMLNESLDTTIEEIRNITHNLSNQIVKEIGLKQSVGQLLNDCAKALNATNYLVYEVPADVELSEEVSKMIYRIIQEALSNSMKYSKANTLEVSIRFQNKQLVLEIKDDGIGFDHLNNTKDGIGLENIKQRVSYLNGFYKITSALGKGTHVKIKIPI